MTLSDKVVTAIAKPGQYVPQGAVRILPKPRPNIIPQLASGAVTPKPRKLRLASANSAADSITVTCTISGDEMFGRMCLVIERMLVVPLVLAASM